MPDVMRRTLKWGGITAAALMGLLLLMIVVAAATDRPSAEPVVIDHDAPEVVAFLDAEHAWMAHHDLDYREHLVEVDDPSLRVRVLEIGEGPPVLILPGATGEAAYFAPLLAELDGYRFLLVNLPGGGASDGIDLRAIDHRRLARNTLDAVYDHFGLDAIPLVANSRGGAWAWWYGLDRPERVAANVQLGTPAGVEGSSVPAVLGILGVPGLNRIAAASLLPVASPDEAGEGLAAFGHPPETVDALPTQAREFQYREHRLPTFALSWRSLGQDSFHFAGLRGWNPELAIDLDDLARHDHPTLLIWPPNDPFGDPDVGREIAEHLPDAEFQVRGVGHLPWLDDPAGIAELVGRFLNVDKWSGKGVAEDEPGCLRAVPAVEDLESQQRDAEAAAAVVGIELVQHDLADAGVVVEGSDCQVQTVRVLAP